MRFPAAAITAAVVLAAAAPALAETIRVPGDYDTIGEAVEAALDGDTVLVGKGTYEEEVSVTGKTNLVIRGAGWPVILAGSGSAFYVNGGSSIRIEGFRIESGENGVFAQHPVGLMLSRLRISGVGTHGVHLGDCTGAVVRSCSISGTGLDAFRLEGCTGASILRCTGTGLGGNGVTDFSSSGLVVDGCSFGPLEGDGMNLSFLSGGSLGSNGAVISRNRVRGAGSGIRFGGENARLERNRVEGLSYYGISLEGFTSSTGTVISGNRIESTFEFQLYVIADQVTMEGNALQAGSVFAVGTALVVDRNRVADSPAMGIRIEGGSAVVTGNQVWSALDQGMYVVGADFTVEGNRVSSAGSTGIHVAVGPGTLARNTVSKCGGAGIFVEAAPVSVTGNKASRNEGFDFADAAAEGVNTLEGNRFGTSAFNAD